ncbi:MAG: hypothetical protein AAF350_01840 [Pseudomonadota bacterium]
MRVLGALIALLAFVAFDDVRAETDCDSVIEGLSFQHRPSPQSAIACIDKGALNAVHAAEAAIRFGHAELAAVLIKHSALRASDRHSPIVGKDAFAKPLLGLAAESDLVSVVELLLEGDSKILDDPDVYWWTGASYRSPLVLAMRASATSTLALLLERSPDGAILDALELAPADPSTCVFVAALETQALERDLEISDSYREAAKEAAEYCGPATIRRLLLSVSERDTPREFERVIFRRALMRPNAFAIERTWKQLLRAGLDDRVALCSLTSHERQLIAHRLTPWLSHRINHSIKRCQP